MVRKLLIITALVFTTTFAYGENSILKYGYYENTNEISAKDRLIPNVDNIFDFENKANPKGEKIEKGRYYIDTKYKGGNNGTDRDHVYLDEFVTDKDLSDVNKNIKWNKTAINQVKEINSNQTSRINNNANRLSELEETQYILGLDIRLYDSKRWKVKVFADYSSNRGLVDRAGVRFTFKFGQSYEEKLIRKHIGY